MNGEHVLTRANVIFPFASTDAPRCIQSLWLVRGNIQTLTDGGCFSIAVFLQ